MKYHQRYCIILLGFVLVYIRFLDLALQNLPKKLKSQQLCLHNHLFIVVYCSF